MQKGAKHDKGGPRDGNLGNGARWPELRFDTVLGSLQTSKVLWAVLRGLRISPKGKRSQEFSASPDQTFLKIPPAVV